MLLSRVEEWCTKNEKMAANGGTEMGMGRDGDLIPGCDVLHLAVQVHPLRNVRALLLDGHQDVAGLAVETLLARVVPDVFNQLADLLLVVHVPRRGNLPKHHHHARLGSRF